MPTSGRGPWVAALTALAYALAGAAALLLAGPPAYAAPLYPSAGIAVAAAVAYGRAALPGVWLGAFAVNAGLGALRGQPPTFDSLLLPAFIGLGAALQAGVGAWLVRRFCGPLVTLDDPASIARAGLLGGALACTLSPSFATPALLAAGVLTPESLAANWGTWWLGDTLGVLIAAPLALTLIGQPAADWRPRRRTLALPLLAALGLVALGVQQTQRLEAERRVAEHQRVAEQLVAEAVNRLDGAAHALQALAAAARVQGSLLDGTGLSASSEWWLQSQPALQATGVGVRVAAAELPAFEAAAQAAGAAGYRVFDRDGGDDRRQRGEVLAVRHLQPLQDNQAALGVNSLSIPAARAAIEATRDTGEAHATAAFRLTQSAKDEPGVVVYQALYRRVAGEPALPATVEERRRRFEGVLFVTLRTEAALADLATIAAGTSWCLQDTDARAALRRLAGAAQCETGITPLVGQPPQANDTAAAGTAAEASAGQPRGAAAVQAERTLRWGGRQYQLQVFEPEGHQPSVTGAAWLLGLAGLTAAAMLGALLLTVTGHARRTEHAVQAATERLRTEIGERERSEAAEREINARLRSILDHAPLGLLFLDPQGRIVECNPRFAEMCGRSAESLPGLTVLDLLPREDADTIMRARRDLIAGQAGRVVARARLRVGPEDGAAFAEVRVVASALRDGTGKVLRMVAMVEDVGDQLRLEASEKARHRAEASDRAKNEFLSRMSHELRTPLNAMIGFAQLLGLDREPVLPAHQADWAQQIQRAGWHLLELINDTLDLSRIESGSLSLALQPVDLAQLAEAVRSLVAGAAAQRGVAVTIEAAPGLPPVEADPLRLRQVLTNLLSNAVKYNRPQGAVSVRIGADGKGQLLVSVSDTGLGMSREQLQRLFQPYDRLGREGSGVEGTGIGLVIARRLIELMGGTLAVDSRSGEGSTFTVRLPASPQPLPPARLGAETGPAPYAQRLVHYVEDNPTNVEVMRGVLGQRPQVRLEVSTLGLDGLAAIRREPPDLVLLDMQLPDISGPELLRHLKRDDELAKIPVIVVSADATPDHVKEALTLGALHYVTKPVAMAEFLVLLDEALEAQETRWGL
jgi:PAS domain S-box-containing protein